MSVAQQVTFNLPLAQTHCPAVAGFESQRSAESPTMSPTPHADYDVYCYLKQALEPECSVMTEPLPGYYAADRFCYRVHCKGQIVGELQGDFSRLVPGTLVQQAVQLVAEIRKVASTQAPISQTVAPETPLRFPQVRPQSIASRLLPKRDTRTWFSSGRAAFAYLVSEVVRPRRIYLPTFVCWSLVDVMLQRFPDIPLKFYAVDRRLQSELPDDLEADDAVVDIHYFGHRSKLDSAPSVGTVLEDVSHCFVDHSFQLEYHDNEMKNASLNGNNFSSAQQPVRFRFGSLRKAYSVADGGFVDGHFCPVYEADAHADAWLRLQATDWRDLREAENMTDRCFRISDISSQSLAVILSTDTDAAIRQRQANQAFLNDHFPCGRSMVAFAGDECPLLHIRAFESSAERDAVRQYLADRRIFTSIHWPVHNHLQHQRDQVNIEAALWIQDHTLAIPVAEDFDQQHMEWICQTAQEYNRGGGSRFPHLHAG